MEDIAGIVGVFGMPVFIVFIVCLFRFLKARMRHKEILAAIEKGVALPELTASEASSACTKSRIPRWISSVAVGIALIVLSPAFVIHSIGTSGMKGLESLKTVMIYNAVMPTLICFSIGLFFLIRGLLLRKYERQATAPAKPDLQ